MTTVATMAAVRNKPHVLYRLFDADGGLIYLGCTSRDPRRRISEHSWRPWYGDVRTATYECYPNRESARAAERKALATEWPLANVIGVPGRLHALLHGKAVA